MAIDRQYEKIIFECDVCGDFLETDEEDFTTAWTDAKKRGWRTKNERGKWVHFCVKCRLSEVHRTRS